MYQIIIPWYWASRKQNYMVVIAIDLDGFTGNVEDFCRSLESWEVGQILGGN